MLLKCAVLFLEGTSFQNVYYSFSRVQKAKLVCAHELVFVSVRKKLRLCVQWETKN